MKNIVSVLMAAIVLFTPLQQSRAVVTLPPDPKNTSMLVICLMGGVAAVGGFVYYKVKTCQPKYYCVEDPEGNRFPSNATKTERAVNDWVVKSGPYKSYEEAAKICPPQTNQVAIATTGQIRVDEVVIPSVRMNIWYSTNLTSWILRDTIYDDPSHFSWTDTNAILQSQSGFYRVSY